MEKEGVVCEGKGGKKIAIRWACGGCMGVRRAYTNGDEI